MARSEDSPRDAAGRGIPASTPGLNPQRGFDSLLDYYYLLKYDDGAVAEWPRVMDALSVQETYFWREADHFRALATQIIPGLVERQRRVIRIL